MGCAHAKCARSVRTRPAARRETPARAWRRSRAAAAPGGQRRRPSCEQSGGRCAPARSSSALPAALPADAHVARAGAARHPGAARSLGRHRCHHPAALTDIPPSVPPPSQARGLAQVAVPGACAARALLCLPACPGLRCPSAAPPSPGPSSGAASCARAPGRRRSAAWSRPAAACPQTPWRACSGTTAGAPATRPPLFGEPRPRSRSPARSASELLRSR